VTIQSEIYNAVKARGYLDETKWTRDQLVVRQIFKMAEELGEAAEHVSIPAWEGGDAELARIASAGSNAARAFRWATLDRCGIDADALRAELPDILIPLLVLAELMGMDALAAVKEKAEADIGRGVG
jgi:NTP pyrophosphatase (non-canonical NTP hydrolase)